MEDRMVAATVEESQERDQRLVPREEKDPRLVPREEKDTLVDLTPEVTDHRYRGHGKPTANFSMSVSCTGKFMSCTNS
jgi:hypothetical protein